MKPVSFEKAIAEYTALTNRIPTLDEMINLYHLYRTTMKQYKWASFTKFMEWNA